MAKSNRSKATSKSRASSTSKQASARSNKGRQPAGVPLTRWLTMPSAAFAVFGLLFAVFAVTADFSGTERPNDVHWSVIVAWSLAKLRTLNLEDWQFTLQGPRTWLFNVGPLKSGFCEAGNAVVLPGSHCRSDRFPGSIFLAYPFYLIFGTAKLSIVPGTFSAVAGSAAALALMFRSLVRLVAPAVAVGATFLMAFTTGVWTVAANLPWTHAAVLLGLGIGTWALASDRPALVGAGYAFAIVSRPQSAAVPLVAGLWQSWGQRSLKPALKIGAASALGVLVLLIYNRINSGQWAVLTGSYAGRGEAAIAPVVNQEASYLGPLRPLYDLWGAFLSPWRGVLVLSPWLLLLVPGLRQAWRESPLWVRSSALGGLGYLLVQLLGNRYSGGLGYFGYRVTLEPLFLCLPLLALSFQGWVANSRWRLRIFCGFAVASLWWFAWGALYFRLPVGADFDPWRFDFLEPWRTGRIGQLALSLFVALGIAAVMRWIWRQPGSRDALIEIV